MKSSQHCVHRDGRDVPVLVERKRVKNFNLHVRTNASVFCSAPNEASDKQIEDFLNRHASWIVRHVERAEQATRMQARPDGPNRGGLIPLWGKLADATGINPNTAAIQQLYRLELEKALPRIVEQAEVAMGVHAERWSIRAMKTRWGSCTPARKTIRINTQLAAYPPLCLEMVVVHELVHLLEPSHNARFHALLDAYCPSNREASRILKQSPIEAADMTRGAELKCCSAPR